MICDLTYTIMQLGWMHFIHTAPHPVLGVESFEVRASAAGTTFARISHPSSPTTGELNHTKGKTMLRMALVFLIIALLAGMLGLFRVEWLATEIAWVLLIVFLVLFLFSFVLGRRSPPTV